jgi:hypothetical protein
MLFEAQSKSWSGQDRPPIVSSQTFKFPSLTCLFVQRAIPTCCTIAIIPKTLGVLGVR